MFGPIAVGTTDDRTSGLANGLSASAPLVLVGVLIGDPAFDVTQHLLNCRTRLRVDPNRTIALVSKAAGVDADRARRWLFARLAAEPGRDDAASIELARRVSNV